MRSAYVEPHDIAVWMPENGQPGARHPVLYILDLEQLPDSAGRRHDASGPAGHIAALAQAALCWSAIVVGIGPSPAHLRHYAPATPLAVLPTAMRRAAEHTLGGVSLSDSYLRFIVGELKPAIDASFPTLPSRDRTSIAGAGIGGLAALYALTRYPGTFVGAACLSTERPVIAADSALGRQCDAEPGKLEDAISTYLARSLPHARDHRIYADYGAAGIDLLADPMRRAIERIAQLRGYRRYRDLQTEPVTQHDRSDGARLERADIAADLLLKPDFFRPATD